MKEVKEPFVREGDGRGDLSDVPRQHRNTVDYRETSRQAAWFCRPCGKVWFRETTIETCSDCKGSPEPVLWNGEQEITPIIRRSEAPVIKIIGKHADSDGELDLECGHVVRLTQDLTRAYGNGEFDSIGCAACWQDSRKGRETGGKRMMGGLDI